MTSLTGLMPQGQPIYSCACLTAGGASTENADRNIEAIAQEVVQFIATRAGQHGLCSVAGTRIAARALVYVNTLQMTILHDTKQAVLQTVAERELVSMVEQELARGDANVGGIDTIYKQPVLAKPKPAGAEEEE